jgi:hypothetical protein
VVAAGTANTGRGTVPFGFTSRDGGQTWRQVSLPAPAGGTVTGLTASGTGFTATGTNGQHPVTWTSPNGLAWSVAHA